MVSNVLLQALSGKVPLSGCKPLNSVFCHAQLVQKSQSVCATATVASKTTQNNLCVDTNATVGEVLLSTGFSLGGRSVGPVAGAATAGVQPVRRAMPQLLRNGLSPENHIRKSLQTTHPCMRPASLPPYGRSRATIRTS